MADEMFSLLLSLVKQEIEVVEELQMAGSELIRALQKNDARKVVLVAGQEEFLAARLAEMEEKRRDLEQSIYNRRDTKGDSFRKEKIFHPPGEAETQLSLLYEELAGAVRRLQKTNDTGRILLARAFWVHRQLVKIFAPEEEEKYDQRGFVRVGGKKPAVFDRQV